jgi:hypothetical protein
MPGHYLEQIDLPFAYGWMSFPAEGATFAGAAHRFRILSIGRTAVRFSRNYGYYLKSNDEANWRKKAS